MEGDMPRGCLHRHPHPAELYLGEKAKINPHNHSLWQKALSLVKAEGKLMDSPKSHSPLGRKENTQRDYLLLPDRVNRDCGPKWPSQPWYQGGEALRVGVSPASPPKPARSLLHGLAGNLSPASSSRSCRAWRSLWLAEGTGLWRLWPTEGGVPTLSSGGLGGCGSPMGSCVRP